MKTVIIYESVYGNTLLVAEELAAVAREHGDVDLVRAEEADAATVEGADLVLIGGPTHLHGMSTHASDAPGPGRGRARPGGHRRPPRLGPDVPGPGPARLVPAVRVASTARRRRRSTRGSTAPSS